MKGRESGMPARETWEQFFKPEEVLKIMGLDERVADVAEFGCGYGTFTIPAAEVVDGTIYAMDIELEMIAFTEDEAKKQGLGNIQTIQRDFMVEGSGLKDESVDYAMLFNILHVEHPEILLKEAYRILRRRGKVGIIHWNYDPATPRGPSMDIRPRPAQCLAWAREAGFFDPKQHDLKPYHYGIAMRKNEE